MYKLADDLPIGMHQPLQHGLAYFPVDVPLYLIIPLKFGLKVVLILTDSCCISESMLELSDDNLLIDAKMRICRLNPQMFL